MVYSARTETVKLGAEEPRLQRLKEDLSRIVMLVPVDPDEQIRSVLLAWLLDKSILP